LHTGERVTLSNASDIVPNVGHTSGAQITAIDNGAMDGFSLLPGCDSTTVYGCYSQYTPSEVPNVISLAQTFSVSDRTFGDGPSASWGMHLDAVAATMDGFTGSNTPQPGLNGTLGPGWGCESGDDTDWISPAGKRIRVPSCIPDPALNPSVYPYGGAYRSTSVPHVATIMDELDADGLSWRIYGGIGGIDNSNGYGWSICPSFAGCIYTQQARNLVDNSEVITDATSGILPNFSVVTPTQENSEHNNDSMIQGDNWLGQEVSAIENGPDWASTAIFITWDDCGCFYDHVAPPSGHTIRVPMIIVSPYAMPAHTDSNIASYSSVLAFTEHNFGLPPLSSLDAAAYDYSDSFDFTQKPLAPVHMITKTISSTEKQFLLQHPANPNDPT
jgi:phospholipase C